jgi:hypothetical protein
MQMEQPQVLAQAIVDVGKFACPVGMTPFVVTVWGEVRGGKQLPRRRYEIAANIDDAAAKRGLDLYEAEFERPN